MAKILAEGVGADQTFDVSLLSFSPSEEEVFALDRRVEFFRVEP